MDAATLRALLAEDLQEARRLSGLDLTPFFLTQGWLWRLRVDQIAADPSAEEWVARAAVTEPGGVPVGTLGFHGPPDDGGMVEVGYTVDPAHRRRGVATAMLRLALAEAAADPRVNRVRASISPDNAASLGTIRRFGFVRVGEQIDEEDGLEILYEWDATR
jgi:ribosomal-protein-alanine N-acetyltransferase